MFFSFPKYGPWALSILALLFFWTAFTFPKKNKNINYSIDPSSSLIIEGSSNINSFYCKCEEEFQEYCCSLKEDENSTKLIFENTALEVKTRSFDCGSRPISKDMWKTLRSQQYPYIRIVLQEAVPNRPGDLQKICKEWVPFKVKTMITIAGTERTVQLDVVAKELQKDQYRFSGAKDLLMSDFGIDPPKAVLGLIKVNDRITIDLDLMIDVIPDQ